MFTWLCMAFMVMETYRAYCRGADENHVSDCQHAGAHILATLDGCLISWLVRVRVMPRYIWHAHHGGRTSNLISTFFVECTLPCYTIHVVLVP